MREPVPGSHFATMEQQAHAAHLGMWLFLASEVLLFAGLVALYGAYRGAHPAGFAVGIAHNTRVLGALNTAVLLTSSYVVAAALHALRSDRRARSVGLLLLAATLGGVFLAVKLTEYALHFRAGIYPGGAGRFFAEHGGTHGLAPFWTLYYLTTGLHAVHVTAGILVLAWTALRIVRGRVTPATSHGLALAAMYWHLVDIVWIVVWPLYYLAGSQ